MTQLSLGTVPTYENLTFYTVDFSENLLHFMTIKFSSESSVLIASDYSATNLN